MDISYERALEMDRLMRESEFQNLLFSEMLSLVTLEGDEIVLDVGTGTGLLAEILAEKLKEGAIFGVDQSPAMLRVAQEKVVQKKLHNYYLLKCPAEELVFRDALFDLAFCVRALHHFADPAMALKELNRVLKGEGKLVMCEPLSPEDEELKQVLTEAFQAGHPGYKFFAGADLYSLFQGAGFAETQATDMVFTFDQDGTGGIPMGPHYLQAYQLIKSRGDEELLRKFERELFQVTERGGLVHLRGKLGFLVTVLGRKR